MGLPLHTRNETQSKQWTRTGDSAPKKAKVVASARKIIASVSYTWDARRILLIHYFEKGKAITSEYYSNLLGKLNTNVYKIDLV